MARRAQRGRTCELAAHSPHAHTRLTVGAHDSPLNRRQDATAWMGMYAGDMLTIAIELATHVSTAYEDVCSKVRRWRLGMKSRAWMRRGTSAMGRNGASISRTNGA